ALERSLANSMYGERAVVRGLDMGLPAMPKEIDGQPQDKKQHSDQGIRGIFPDRSRNDEPADRDKDDGRERVAWSTVSRTARRQTALAPPEDEQATCGNAEEKKIHRDHIIEDLFISARQGHHCRPHAL